MESERMYQYIESEFESDYNLETLLEDKSETYKIIKHIKEKNNLCFKASSFLINHLDADANSNEKVIELVIKISNYYSVQKTNITNYILEIFSDNPTLVLPIIKYLHNSYYITKVILTKELIKLDNSSSNKAVINYFKELQGFLNSYTLFFSVFLDADKIDSALINYKIDVTNDVAHKYDKRFKKKHITSPQIAYSISHVFASIIGELTKQEKIILFGKITGRSGDDIYQYYGNSKKLTISEAEQIENELNEIKSKIKKK
jgi:hypothetical protein